MLRDQNTPIGFFSRVRSAYVGSPEQALMNKLLPEIEDVLNEIPYYAKGKKMLKEIGDVLGIVGDVYDAYGEKDSFFTKLGESGASRSPTRVRKRPPVKRRASTSNMLRPPIKRLQGARYAN